MCSSDLRRRSCPVPGTARRSHGHGFGLHGPLRPGHRSGPPGSRRTGRRRKAHHRPVRFIQARLLGASTHRRAGRRNEFGSEDRPHRRGRRRRRSRRRLRDDVPLTRFVLVIARDSGSRPTVPAGGPCGFSLSAGRHRSGLRAAPGTPPAPPPGSPRPRAPRSCPDCSSSAARS